jgi:DNA-binding MarR family transcriptional regulator
VESRISADPLVGLCKKGAVSQQELADHLLLTKGNVVGLIERLRARGSWNGVAPRRTDT